MMTVSLLCLLEGVIALAVIALVLYVLFWAVRAILGSFQITIPPRVQMLLQVIGVLLLVYIIVRAIATGHFCGLFGLTVTR